MPRPVAIAPVGGFTRQLTTSVAWNLVRTTSKYWSKMHQQSLNSLATSKTILELTKHLMTVLELVEDVHLRSWVRIRVTWLCGGPSTAHLGGPGRSRPPSDSVQFPFLNPKSSHRRGRAIATATAPGKSAGAVPVDPARLYCLPRAKASFHRVCTVFLLC